MAKILVTDPTAVQTLRELTGSKKLFPFADYSPSDPKVYIGITLYREHDDNPNLKAASDDFIETAETRLPSEVREAIFNQLIRINPDSDIIEKLKTLGFEIEFPKENRRSNGFWNK